MGPHFAQGEVIDVVEQVATLIEDTRSGNIRAVIYVHCGWPRTGTTSLQTVLAAHCPQLAEAGLCYPNAWRSTHENAHYGLTEVLERLRESRRQAVADFKRSLAGYVDRDVVLSNEALTNWLSGEDKLEALLTLLRAANDVAPVTCVWVLRRFDEMAHSGYVQLALGGVRTKPPVEFMQSLPTPGFFRAMRRVEDAVGGRVSYVPYDSGMGRKLLASLGLPSALARTLGDELSATRSRNASSEFTQKQVTAAMKLDELCARLEMTIDRSTLRRRFRDSSIQFEGDSPCELVGPEVRRDLHRRALQTADEADLSSYLRFFADDDLGKIPPAGNFCLDEFSNEDLQRLVVHMSRYPSEDGACW